MKIAAFDIATSTGVCIGGAGETPRLLSFTIGKKKCELGFFLHDAMRQFGALIGTERPDRIIFEAPILPGTTSIQTVRKLQGLAGIVEMLAFAANIPCNEVSGHEVKKELSGHAHAQKHHQVAAARILGFNPATDDEADSIGIWLCAIKVLDPPLYKVWSARKNTIPYQENLNAVIRESAERRAKRKPKPAGGLIQA